MSHLLRTPCILVVRKSHTWIKNTFDFTASSTVIDGTSICKYVNDDDFRAIGNKNDKGEWIVPMKSLGEGAAT